MAQGRSNSGIAQQLFVTEGTVEKHVRSVLEKLDLPETTDDHRRVLAARPYPSGARHEPPGCSPGRGEPGVHRT